MIQAAGNNYPFDRPVIILAAPRSGSTLLFETLANSTDFWTIGGESHGVFEKIPQFNPLLGMCDSNALSADDASDTIVSEIHASFLAELRNSQGHRYGHEPEATNDLPRLLEKTPKNAVRVSLLNKVFPDALFIYLYRNPRENISSMMDAWNSGRFVTYRNLPGRGKPWSLLLPPGWQKHHESPLATIAAYQWRAANTAILQELSKIPSHRWTAVSYGQQIHETRQTVQRLCEFCGVSPAGILNSLSHNTAKLSRYTLTTPAPDKWHKNAATLNTVLPDLADSVDYIRQMAPGLPEAEFDLSIDPALLNVASELDSSEEWQAIDPVRRNARCHCGSGKRFKHCHGSPRQPGAAS